MATPIHTRQRTTLAAANCWGPNSRRADPTNTSPGEAGSPILTMKVSAACLALYFSSRLVGSQIIRRAVFCPFGRSCLLGLAIDKNRLGPGERYKKTEWDWNQNELNGESIGPSRISNGASLEAALCGRLVSMEQQALRESRAASLTPSQYLNVIRGVRLYGLSPRTHLPSEIFFAMNWGRAVRVWTAAYYQSRKKPSQCAWVADR